MTDKELGEILNAIVIISDTRENKNQHILDYFKENGIPYKREKLNSCDYSFEINLTGYEYLNHKILIERKNSLSELAGNFTKGRERFQREFERIPYNTNKHLIIETATFKKLLAGSYRSELNPNSYLASLLSYNAKYDLNTWFCNTSESGMLIYKLIYYNLRNILKNT